MDRVGTAHLTKKCKQSTAKAASEESPAGTKLSYPQFLKMLSKSQDYQQSLALIKCAVSDVLIFDILHLII
jgi:hypothetical protein